jgi:hypothetical protein
MSNNGTDYPAMEAVRPTVKYWSVIEEVASLLLIIEWFAYVWRLRRFSLNSLRGGPESIRASAILSNIS